MKFKRAWNKIKKGVEKELPAKRGLALLRARILLERYLDRGGYTGVDLEERLRNLPEGSVSNPEELLLAEKICQKVLKDARYQVSKQEAKKTVEAFEQAFSDLELL